MPDKKEEMALAIGQIIYILSNKNQAVLPALVVEEATCETLQGKSVSWKVAIGKGEKRRVVDSTRINGEIFVSLDDIHDLLQKRLAGFVAGVVKDARVRESEWYGTEVPKDKVQPTAATNKKSKVDEDQLDPEDIIRELSNSNSPADAILNGLPTSPGPSSDAENQTAEDFAAFTSGMSRKEKAVAARARLRELADPGEDDTSFGPVAASSTHFSISAPDGTKIPVKI